MSRRGENIRKRKDGRWEARLLMGKDCKGKSLYRSLYGKTYHEAKAKLMAAAISKTISADPVSTNKRLSEVLKIWLERNRIQWKGSTLAKYRYLIDRHIQPELGMIEIEALTVAQINNFLAQKSMSGRLDGKGGLSAALVRAMAMVLHSALQFAAEEGFCSYAVSRIYKPAPERVEISVLNAEEQRRLEKALLTSEDPLDLGILLALRLGLRLGEICALSWKDIDLEAGIICIEHLNIPNAILQKLLRILKQSFKMRSQIKTIPDGSNKKVSSSGRYAIRADTVVMLEAVSALETCCARMSDLAGFVGGCKMQYTFGRSFNRSIKYQSERIEKEAKQLENLKSALSAIQERYDRLENELAASV